jgi:phospholipid transport system transporter-binding protein
MAKAGITAGGDGVLRVAGDVTFATAATLLEQGDALLKGDRTLVIDLEQAGNCDSAGVALLLEWMERARVKGVEIRYRNIPAALLDIARLSNVDPLLPLADG